MDRFEKGMLIYAGVFTAFLWAMFAVSIASDLPMAAAGVGLPAVFGTAVVLVMVFPDRPMFLRRSVRTIVEGWTNQAFEGRCPHCKAVNWGPCWRRVKGHRWSKRWITHSADCPYRAYYSKGSR
jgi:hypothetical protein